MCGWRNAPAGGAWRSSTCPSAAPAKALRLNLFNLSAGHAGQPAENGLGVGDELPDEVTRWGEVVDGAGALPGGIELATGIHAFGRLRHADVAGAVLDGPGQLGRERLD